MGRLYALMAQAEGNQDEALKAIQYFKDALKADPKASDTYEELTDLYLALNRGGDAIALAQEALKQNPDNVDAHRMLGRVYFSQINKSQQGQIDERALHMAMSEFQKVTDKDPKDVDSWVTWAAVRRHQRFQRCREGLQHGAGLDPDNEEALTGLALVYGNNGETGKAIEKLKAATEKNPNPRSLMILAEAYRNQKNFKDAADAEKKALEMQPDNERLARSLADDLFFSEQYDEALQIFGELATRNPKDTAYPLRMADIYGAKHDYAKAHEAIDKAKKIDPGDEDPRLAEIRMFEMEAKHGRRHRGAEEPAGRHRQEGVLQGRAEDARQLVRRALEAQHPGEALSGSHRSRPANERLQR
jgi:tetratricopeptide (TPR) repeat protein